MSVDIANMIPPTVMLTLLAAITIHDIRHQRIPDILTVALALAGVLASAGGYAPPPPQAIAGALLGLALTWLVRSAYFRACGQHGLGLGDVKLTAACGFWLGPRGIGLMLLVATSAAIFWLVLRHLTAGRPLTRKTALPFAPWLALGAMVSYLIMG